MKSKYNFLTLILAPLLALCNSAAWGQTATVTYATPASIPVLGGGMLLLLGLLLAALGVFWLSRRPEIGRPLSLSLAVLGATLVLVSSGWLASNARAVSAIFLLSENPSPVVIDTFPAELSNDLEVPVELKSISISGCPEESQLSGTCAPQLSLAPGNGSCSIDSICAEDNPINGEVCFSSNEFAQEDPWVICDIDQDEAWISASNGGVYNAPAICQALGFDAVGQQGGTCGNVCGYCEGATSCESPGTRNFDNGGGDPTELQNTVQWTCVNNPE
jgi:hypothetical protein